MTAISADTTIDSSPAVRLLDCRHKTASTGGSKVQTGARGQTSTGAMHTASGGFEASRDLFQQVTWCKPQLSLAGSVHDGN
jgi:hypothetical protein